MPGALFIPVISALIKSRGQAPMRMDKLTSKFQMALADAQSLAVGRDHQFIEPVHLLIALLDQAGGSVCFLLCLVVVFVFCLCLFLGAAFVCLFLVVGVF